MAYKSREKIFQAADGCLLMNTPNFRAAVPRRIPQFGNGNYPYKRISYYSNSGSYWHSIVHSLHEYNMASTYQGIYTLKDVHGKIEAVQIEDSFGKGSTLPIEEYIRQKIEPPAEVLPDKKSYLQ
jgi:hypothetical protein